MFARALPANPTLSDRFSWVLGVLFEQMAREVRRRGIRQAVETAIQRRISGLWVRLRSVLARWGAGTLTAPRTRAKGAAHAVSRPDALPRGGRERACLLPPEYGWLTRLLAHVEFNAVQPLLDDPEMQAIFERAPQVGRILRPWCRLFGLEMPGWLKLPKRTRVRKKRARLAEEDEAALGRLTARFPDTPPARSAKRALRRMFAGLPVDVKRLSAVALGYVLHPPRDDNCPPPEIGYGGRSFGPLPKDYKRPDWD